VASAVLHGLVVAAAVYAKASGNATEAPPPDTVNYTEYRPAAEPPPPVKHGAPPPPADNVPPPTKGFQTVNAPISIPTMIPEINIADALTNPADFVPTGTPGGFATGVDRKDSVLARDVMFQFEVEKVARLAPGNPEPMYPAVMRRMCQTGKVRVSFVIDTTGNANMESLKVVESTNELFTAEVRRVLSKYKFIPAEVGRRKVRMHVELPFEFRMAC
jgi:protein TonB